MRQVKLPTLNTISDIYLENELRVYCYYFKIEFHFEDKNFWLQQSVKSNISRTCKYEIYSLLDKNNIPQYISHSFWHDKFYNPTTTLTIEFTTLNVNESNKILNKMIKNRKLNKKIHIFTNQYYSGYNGFSNTNFKLKMYVTKKHKNNIIVF